MQRIDPELAQAYRKNAADEDFLSKLNSLLGPHEDAGYADIPEIWPTLHIMGVPRSGTTLLSQLVSSHLQVGYVNHMIASFWKAPVMGIRLSKKLLKDVRDTDYSSNFGRTTNLWEPHEFGYFWAHQLRKSDLSAPTSESNDVDWDMLRKVLMNMCQAFDAPMVFKSVLLGWYLKDVATKFNHACVVRIRRDPIDNAISLMKYRREFLGSVDKWVSLKPKEYSWLQHLSVEEQVAGQVHYLDEAYTRGLAHMPAHRVLDLTYDELCSEPRQVMQKVVTLLQQNNADVKTLSLPPETFSKGQSSGDKVLIEKLQSAFDRFTSADFRSNDAACVSSLERGDARHAA